MIKKVTARGLFALVALVGYAAPAAADERDPIAADLHETVVQVPMTEHGLFGEHTRDIVATTYMPDGAGPFPLIVLSHGNPPNARDRFKVGRYRKLAQIREFVQLGFAVIVPIRRGYGATGGSYAEDTGSCSEPDFESAGREAAQDLLATIAFADTLPQVDRNNVILVGQSAGGFASLAAASYAPKGLVAVINFSGGRGGDPSQHPGQPCSPEQMADDHGAFRSQPHRCPCCGTTSKTISTSRRRSSRPGSVHSRRQGDMANSIVEPPFGRDGHGMFAVDRAIPIWLPHFEQFVAPIVH